MLAPAGKALVETAGLGLANAEGDFKACGAHPLGSASGYGGIGIDGCGHHAGKSGGDQSFRTGAGAAGVVAGLERDVGGAAAESFAGVLCGDLESDHFGVVEKIVLVPAFAGNLAGAVEKDAADGGVRGGEGDTAASQLESALHPVMVLVGCGH